MKSVIESVKWFAIGLTLLVIFMAINAFDKDFGAHE